MMYPIERDTKASFTERMRHEAGRVEYKRLVSRMRRVSETDRIAPPKFVTAYVQGRFKLVAGC